MRSKGGRIEKSFSKMRGNYIHNTLFKPVRLIDGQVKKPGRFVVETEM